VRGPIKLTSTLIKNATIYTVSGPVIEKGDVLISNGKIEAIGQSIDNQSVQTVLDAEGQLLLPGLIDAHTHLGLYDEGTGWAGNDANETVDVTTPHVRAIDSVHPGDHAFREAIRAGITSAHIMPGSANVIGGVTAVIKTFGKRVDRMTIRHPAGLKIALGENPKRVHSDGSSSSMTRMGIMGLLRETFYEAKNSDTPEAIRIRPILMALNREIPVRIHAHRSDDIISAIRFAEEFELDLRIEHCTEGHLIADVLDYPNLKVTVGPTLTRRSKVELRNKTWDTYKVLVENGIEVSITTDHPYTPIQYLNVCASLAVREGLDEDTALKAITLHPARSLGVDHRIGSIEVGKDADLVLWNRHPFDYLAKPIWTMIDGQMVYQQTTE
jgi:imidazolonepropionase-like amidohydrolase